MVLHAGTYFPPDHGPLPAERSEVKCADLPQHYSLHKLRYLYEAGKIVSADEVVGFQEDFSQFAGANRVVLGIELIEAVEGVSPLSGSVSTDQSLPKTTTENTEPSGAFPLPRARPASPQ